MSIPQRAQNRFRPSCPHQLHARTHPTAGAHTTWPQAKSRSRVVALIGPRQSGKTTLARQIVPNGSGNHFDLEDPTSRALLTQPMTALEGLRGVVVIDEVQHRRDLFQVSTVRGYLDLCTNLLIVRQLQPWHENLTKRQVKAPKVYVRDSGLLHTLLGIRTEKDLLAHPKSGASSEGYAVEEVLNAFEPEQAYFWATHQGAELDLLLFKRSRRIGIEIKRADAPTITSSMRIALADLRLDQLIVLYPGSRTYDLDRQVHVVPLSRLAAGDLQAMLGKPERQARSKRS